jgi:hypothetical protein
VKSQLRPRTVAQVKYKAIDREELDAAVASDEDASEAEDEHEAAAVSHDVADQPGQPSESPGPTAPDQAHLSPQRQPTPVQASRSRSRSPRRQPVQDQASGSSRSSSPDQARRSWSPLRRPAPHQASRSQSPGRQLAPDRQQLAPDQASGSSRSSSPDQARRSQSPLRRPAPEQASGSSPRPSAPDQTSRSPRQQPLPDQVRVPPGAAEQRDAAPLDAVGSADTRKEAERADKHHRADKQSSQNLAGGKVGRSGESGSRVRHRRRQRLLWQSPEVKELREVLTGGILVVQVPQLPRP